jgi:hypothetical protein
MKVKYCIQWALVACLVMLPVTVTAAQEKADDNLVYSVPEAQYNFQPVVDGTEILHDFVIKNTGKDVLTIMNVRTG